ncbi:MAG: MFS transporter, partial [Actinobacteria bacterium]|nr:MFS transporter [Actinomycetota bacterium]
MEATDAPEPRIGRATKLALVLAALSSTSAQMFVVPALPDLQRDLDTTAGWATWTLTAYLLVLAVSTPILGRLGDQHGKVRIVVAVLCLQIAASVAAAFAWDIASLIVFRMLQAPSGAIFPLLMALVSDEFPKRLVGAWLGIISSTMAMGTGLGLTIAGPLTEQLSWRAIFVVAAALAALALVLVVRSVPESTVRTKGRTDWIGAALLSIGMLAVLVGITEGSSWGWGSARILGLLLGGAAGLAIWAGWERRCPEPMVDLRMLTTRAVLVTNVVALAVGTVLYGSFAILPAFIQAPRGLDVSIAAQVDYGFGQTATIAGLYLVPSSVSAFVGAMIVGRLVKARGAVFALALGCAVASAGSAIAAVAHGSPWTLIPAIMLFTPGGPLTSAASAFIIVRAVRPGETGVATGMN